MNRLSFFLVLTAAVCLTGLMSTVEAAQAKKSPPDKKSSKSKPAAKKKAAPKVPTAEEMSRNAKKKIQAATEISKTAGWKRSTMNPNVLASQMAKAVAGLRNTYGQVYSVLTTPAGNGTIEQEFKIQDPSRYIMDLAVYEERPQENRMVANGRYRLVRIPGQWMRPMLVGTVLPGAKASPPKMAERWGKDFPRLIFQGFTDNRDAIAPVVAEWVKGTGGYKVRVEERTITKGKASVSNYRLIAERTPAAAKSLGKSMYEMIVDKRLSLPVTIRIQNVDKNGKETRIMWSTKYMFKQKFKQTDFAGPFPKR